MADEVANYIAQRAQALGIEPQTALKVYRSEGAGGYIGDGNSSFGPFQLHYGGVNPDMPHPGLGDAFTEATGLDARNPSTWRQQVDFSLNQAKQGGWSPWMGAKAVGITGYAGIGSQAALGKTINSLPAAPPGPGAGPGSEAYPQPAGAPAAPVIPPPPPIGAQLATGDFAGAAKQALARPPAKPGEEQAKSPLEKIASSLGGGGQPQKLATPDLQSPPVPPIQDPMAGMAPAAQALFSQLVAAQKPLTWGRRPYGAEAGPGPSAPGTTLNSLQDYYG